MAMKTDTEHDYRRRIARVVEAINADPAAAHNTESLAAIAHFSPFHFHRLYRAMTGESVACTVRRARLALAAQHLSGGKRSILHAANDAGYDNAQSFARAFREMTGFSPSAFQEQQQLIGAEQPVVVLERPAMTIHTLRHEGPLATIPHTYRRLYRICEEAGLLQEGLRAIGVSHGNPEQAEEFHYLAGLLLPFAPARVPGLEQVLVPGGSYAAYRFCGAYALIAATFQRLFGHWLPASGFEPDDRPALELYDDDPNRPAEAAPCTELLIPVRENKA